MNHRTGASRARLGLATVGSLPASMRPRVGPGGLAPGIVHMGLGAFHRAHQAVFTEDAMAASGEDRWAICGASQRSPGALGALRAQDGLYTVLEHDRGVLTGRVVGCLRELLFAGAQWELLEQRMADPATAIVTLTVTEKGYCRDSSTGALALADPDLAADLAGALPPRTLIGRLVAGLAARMRAGAGPISLLPCDNLPANGRLLAGLVRQFCERLPPSLGLPLGRWIDDNAAFCSTMVDRIVPAAQRADCEAAANLTGLRDDAALLTEPFSQWVIEDSFAGPRPRWELAGAQLVADVAPWEALKLRVLNASHSALALLGSLAGYATIAEAAADEDLAALVRHFLASEVRPVVVPPAGVEVQDYEASVLARFANPDIRHTTAQVATDSSQKLPARIVPTLLEQLGAGREAPASALIIAAWLRTVWAAATDSGRPIAIADPLRAALGEATAGAGTEEEVVERVVARMGVLGEELAGSTEARRLIAAQLRALGAAGARGAARALAWDS